MRAFGPENGVSRRSAPAGAVGSRKVGSRTALRSAGSWTLGGEGMGSEEGRRCARACAYVRGGGGEPVGSEACRSSGPKNLLLWVSVHSSPPGAWALTQGALADGPGARIPGGVAGEARRRRQ